MIAYIISFTWSEPIFDYGIACLALHWRENDLSVISKYI